MANNSSMAVSDESGWALPLYELAMLTASRLNDRRSGDLHLTVATCERTPLEAFGSKVGTAVAGHLDRHGIERVPAVEPLAVRSGALVLADDRSIEADAVVALPRLLGLRLGGLPSDPDGFLPVDRHCRVQGVHHVDAAGDAPPPT